jgi:hypothetical protein
LTCNMCNELQCFKSYPYLFSLCSLTLPPPAYRPATHAAPLARAWAHNSSLAASQDGTGTPEAARLRLQVPEPSVSHSLPLFASTATAWSSIPKFALHIWFLPNSRCQRVHLIPAPRTSPLAPSPAACITPAPLSSLIPTGGAAMSTSPWLGHLGYSPLDLHHILYTLYRLDAHARSFFSSTHVATSERSHLPWFTTLEPPSSSHSTVCLVSIPTRRTCKSW